MASAARGPGGNRLVLDGAIHDDGAVGVLLDAAASPTTVVSQGCRPVGHPFIVTRAERNVLYELAGRPALERLLEMVEELTPEPTAPLRPKACTAASSSTSASSTSSAATSSSAA